MSINSILTSVFPSPVALDILNLATTPDCFFGKQEWAQHFGDVGVEPPLPENIWEILAWPCPFWPEKRVEETHMLVLIPQTIDTEGFYPQTVGNERRGFCLNTLGEIINCPKTGQEALYNYYDPLIERHLGKQTFPSHWVLMTRDVIPGSRRLSYESQRAFVHAHALRTEIPYELPTALEAATTILMKQVQTGEWLYSSFPWETYTRCQEKSPSSHIYRVVIGGYNSSGLNITCCGFFGDGFLDNDFLGAGCVRRL